MKIRCLFITTEFPPGPGGIGVHAYNVINELKKNNWGFKVILTENYNSNFKDFQKFKSSFKFPIILLDKSPNMFLLIKNIIVIINISIKYKPDLIISSGKHAVWYGAILKFFLRKKLVCFAHGSEFGTRNKKEIKINNIAYSYSNLLISVSQYTQNYIQNFTKIKSKKQLVIHNGADHEKFFKLSKKEIDKFKKENNLTNKKIILTLGNVTKRKGQWVTINALPHILKKNPNTFYFCIGLPSEKEKFTRIAKNLKVDNHVIFKGIVKGDELKFWLNTADIFVMTSTHTETGDFEGFGISVIEAALCGTPAVVTKTNNGVIESIVDGKTGFGVEEKNNEDVAEKINYLLKNKKIISEMGEKAYNRAKTNFTWETKTNEINAEIESLLKL